MWWRHSWSRRDRSSSWRDLEARTRCRRGNIGHECLFNDNVSFKITIPPCNAKIHSHLTLRRGLLAAPGVVIPQSSSSSSLPEEALPPPPGLRYGSTGAAATPTSPRYGSTGETEDGRELSRRCCSRSSAGIHNATSELQSYMGNILILLP